VSNSYLSENKRDRKDASLRLQDSRNGKVE